MSRCSFCRLVPSPDKWLVKSVDGKVFICQSCVYKLSMVIAEAELDHQQKKQIVSKLEKSLVINMRRKPQ